MKLSYPNLGSHKERRKRALYRLETQKKTGSKPSKDVFHAPVPLTEHDKKRIDKELTTLKARI